jgi:hypothetical protein
LQACGTSKKTRISASQTNTQGASPADAAPPPLSQKIPSVEECKGDELLPSRLWRVTDLQYKNVIEETFGAAVAKDLPEFQEGRGKGTFANNVSSLVISAPLFSKLYPAGEGFSARVMLNVEDAKQCKMAANTDCIKALATKYGALMWRRPLQAAETDQLTKQAQALKDKGGTQEDAIRYVFEALFHSPGFWYRSEIGQVSDKGPKVMMLDSYEVASLLSFSLWDGPPDAVLYAAAQKNELQTEAAIQAQLTRMMADAKFERGLRTLFDQWLSLRSVLWVEKDAGVFSSTFTPELRKDLREESVTFIREYVLKEKAPIAAVFKAPFSYLNANLAKHYGVTSDAGAQFQKVSLPGDQRLGILTQGAFVTGFSGNKGTGIPHRADFFMNEILCSPLGSPPPNISSKLDMPVETKMTTRQKFEKLHSQNPACSGCHQIMDPIGGAFENFDPIGRFRTTEFDLPVDSSGKFEGSMFGDAAVAYSTGLEMIEHVAGSQKFAQCFTLKAFQNFGGLKAQDSMGCEVARLNSGLIADNYSAVSALRSLGNLKSMLLRKASN